MLFLDRQGYFYKAQRGFVVVSPCAAIVRWASMAKRSATRFRDRAWSSPLSESAAESTRRRNQAAFIGAPASGRVRSIEVKPSVTLIKASAGLLGRGAGPNAVAFARSLVGFDGQALRTARQRRCGLISRVNKYSRGTTL
jgi:hypothetical protein